MTNNNNINLNKRIKLFLKNRDYLFMIILKEIHKNSGITYIVHSILYDIFSNNEFDKHSLENKFIDVLVCGLESPESLYKILSSYGNSTNEEDNDIFSISIPNLNTTNFRFKFIKNDIFKNIGHYFNLTTDSVALEYSYKDDTFILIDKFNNIKDIKNKLVCANNINKFENSISEIIRIQSLISLNELSIEKETFEKLKNCNSLMQENKNKLIFHSSFSRIILESKHPSMIIIFLIETNNIKYFPFTAKLNLKEIKFICNLLENNTFYRIDSSFKRYLNLPLIFLFDENFFNKKEGFKDNFFNRKSIINELFFKSEFFNKIIKIDRLKDNLNLNSNLKIISYFLDKVNMTIKDFVFMFKSYKSYKKYNYTVIFNEFTNSYNFIINFFSSESNFLKNLAKKAESYSDIFEKTLYNESLCEHELKFIPKNEIFTNISEQITDSLYIMKINENLTNKKLLLEGKKLYKKIKENK